jgi:hypothetical protein
MQRCPACRGRLNESGLCARCGCDFDLALRAERQADYLIRTAVQDWAAGNAAQAAACLDESLRLKRSAMAAALALMLQTPA